MIIFISAELSGAGWQTGDYLRCAKRLTPADTAELNPLTYILDVGRTLINIGWDAEIILRGMVAPVLLAMLGFAFACFSLRAGTRRR